MMHNVVHSWEQVDSVSIYGEVGSTGVSANCIFAIEISDRQEIVLQMP